MDDQESKFLIARYNGLSKEIEFSKRIQWIVANGTLVLYGVILTFHLEYFKSCFSKPVAKILCVGIWLVSIVYLISCHASIINNNLRMKEVLKKFPSEQEIEDKIKSKLTIPTSKYIPYLFYAVVTIGFFVTCYLIN